LNPVLIVINRLFMIIRHLITTIVIQVDGKFFHNLKNHMRLVILKNTAQSAVQELKNPHINFVITAEQH